MTTRNPAPPPLVPAAVPVLVTGLDVDAMRPDEVGHGRSLRVVDSKSPSVTRAVAILEELARERGPMALSHLARSLDLAKSTVANLCAALEAVQMIRRVGGRWTLDHKVVELGQGYLASTDLVDEFRRGCATLPTAAAETLLLAVLDDLDVVYLACHDGTQSVRLSSEVGTRMPAVVTALGKAMLAVLPVDELDRRLARLTGLPELTPRSHRTVVELRLDLDVVRERGHALDDEQNTTGVTSLAVSVPGRRAVRAAVSATMLSARVRPELLAGIAADLGDLARRLSVVNSS